MSPVPVSDLRFDHRKWRPMFWHPVVGLDTCQWPFRRATNPMTIYQIAPNNGYLEDVPAENCF